MYEDVDDTEPGNSYFTILNLQRVAEYYYEDIVDLVGYIPPILIPEIEEEIVEEIEKIEEIKEVIPK